MAPKRKLSEREERALVMLWRDAGASGRELAVEYEITERTVWNILARHGITSADREKQPHERNAPPPAPIDPATAAELTELGPPDPDPLKAIAWMHRALAITAWQALREPAHQVDGGEFGRRKELREIARAMASVTPQSAIYQATKIIKADADTPTKPAGPELEDAPEFDGRAHRGAPRRGRPRQL